jgi:uncharacterized protein (TIGR02147 family)
VSVTSLAEVLAGKRGFSRKNAARIAERLCLSPDQARALVRLPEKGFGPTEAYELFQIQEDVFRLVSDWYHFAILNLAKLKSNTADPKILATRLGISAIEVKSALEVLQRLGYLKIEEGRLVRTTTPLFFNPADMPSALRKFHKQNLRLAEIAIDRDPVERRYITSFTLPVDIRRIDEAKKSILNFQKKMVGFLEDGEPSEVYAFVIQLFPLTRNGE